MHQFPFPSFSCLRIYEGDLLPTGMKITTYNHHLKAPSFPVVFVVKQRILCRSGPSLLSNQSLCEAKGGIRCCLFLTLSRSALAALEPTACGWFSSSPTPLGCSLRRRLPSACAPRACSPSC